MNILGIGGYSHDSAAAIVCDGELVAAVAEERLSRVKHDGGIPRRAIRFCLERAGLEESDVDHVTAYMQPGRRIFRRTLYRASQAFAHPLYSAGYIGYEFAHNAQFLAGTRAVGGPKTQHHFLEHHPAHAASAFLVSPYDEAALLSIDYIGEIASTWLGVGRGTDITALKQIAYPNSLGVFYSAITDYLGFLRASDEYKVMGLASYGEPAFADAFREILRPRDGAYSIDRSWTAYHYRPGSRAGYFSEKFLRRFGPPRRRDDDVSEHHANVAASAQLVLEEAVLELCRDLHARTGSKNLCMAGGVALNCAMNGRMLREGPFENIFVQPAAGDDGIAIGGALGLHHRLTGSPRGPEMKSALLGPEFDNDSIREALDLAKVPYQQVHQPAQRAAELIAQGNIVAWFQGRMEFGPRALGARSILADPTLPQMKDQINMYVKHREEFRPFAPSVLEEHASTYFEGCTDSPFMLFVYPVKAEHRETLPAVTHVDGTARVQTVSRASNEQFYRLIEAFEQLRGVPVVLNTSFNVMGEPIVHTPADALRCFFSTGIDALVIGDCVVTKPSARTGG